MESASGMTPSARPKGGEISVVLYSTIERQSYEVELGVTDTEIGEAEDNSPITPQYDFE